MERLRATFPVIIRKIRQEVPPDWLGGQTAFVMKICWLTMDSIASKVKIWYPKIDNKRRELLSFHLDILLRRGSLKPALLIDGKLSFLLSNANFLAESIASCTNELRVFQVQQDVFVVHVDALAQALQRRLEDPAHYAYIDVSKSAGKPVLYKSPIPHDVIRYLLKALDENRRRETSGLVLTITPPEEWNLTLVFGILLDYPTVFSSAEDSTCLSCHDLERYEIRVQDEVLTSFTFPSRLHLKHLADEWYRSRFSGHEDAKLTVSIVNLNSVML